MTKGTTLCPQCERPLQQTSDLCPDHGQVSSENPLAPLRIFLSYGHDHNEELVRQIKADLEKRGHDVWFDKSEIKTGQDWRHAITEGIVDSNRVLSFLSKYSTRDPGVCLDEIAIAIGTKGGNIQTILVESEQEVKPPPSISHIQWLDMHDWKARHDAGDAAWANWYQEKFAEIVAVVESAESRRFAGEIEDLMKALDPISPDSRMFSLLKKVLVGRTWLDEEIEKWREATDRTSRLFWIMGAPGVGKSAYAAHFAHYGKDKVIAVQFCEWNKPTHRNAHQVVRTLAFQIATRLPDFRRLLLRRLGMTDLSQRNAVELFDDLLADPLRLSIGGERERYVIVIDALDEAGRDGQNELVQLLAAKAKSLPDWIGIVVTSRPEKEIIAQLKGLDGLNPTILDTGTESNRADIRDYLRNELAPQLQNRLNADILVKQILERSEGVFLYVECFCDDVQRGNLSLDCPEQFPQGLSGIFLQYFQRQFPDEAEYERTIEPVIGAILAARAPLPFEILQNLFGWPDTELRKCLRTLGSLFPVTAAADGDVIKPYHKSLADWLVQRENSGTFISSVAEGHRRLGTYGCHYMQESPMDVPDYIRRNLAWHLAESRRWDDLASLIDTGKLNLLSTWIDGGLTDDGVFCLSGLIMHLRSRGDHARAAGFATQLARIHSRRGKYDEAETCLREVLNETSFWNGRRDSAIALHELGSLSLYRQDYSQAQSFFRRALRRCQWGIPRYQGEAAANLLGLGTIDQELSHFRKALSLAVRVERITRRIGDLPHQLAALRLRALSYRGLGNYDAAEEVMSSAFALSKKPDVEHEVPRLSMISGWLAYDRSTIAGRGLHAASEHFRSALNGAQAFSNYYILAEATLSLAWCTVVADGSDRDSYSDPRDLHAFRDFPLSSRSHLGLWCGKHVLEAVSAHKAGDPNAKDSYEAAIRLCELNDNLAWRVRALVGLGCQRTQSGETAEAASTWRRALEVARQASAGLARVTEATIETCRLRPGWGPR